MVEITSGVESIQGKLSGKPCIKGTRIPVSIVLANLEHMTIEEIAEEFDEITKEDIQSVIRYARLVIMEEIPVGSVTG